MSTGSLKLSSPAGTALMSAPDAGDGPASATSAVVVSLEPSGAAGGGVVASGVAVAQPTTTPAISDQPNNDSAVLIDPLHARPRRDGPSVNLVREAPPLRRVRFRGS